MITQKSGETITHIRFNMVNKFFVMILNTEIVMIKTYALGALHM